MQEDLTSRADGQPDERGRWANRLGLALCVVGAAMIVLKAVFDRNGYLSPDSTNYLALVENLRAGRGLVTAENGRVPDLFTPFADWPVGYPLLIYGIGAVSRLSSFAASKLVSVGLFGAGGAVIARTFPRHGGVLACVLVLAPTLELYAFTWSEVPFTFLLLGFAALTAKIVRDAGRDAWRHAALALGCGLGLFLSRYIGAFAVGLIGLLALFKLARGQVRYAVVLTGAAGLLALMVGAYLWWNAVRTGFPTGMTRPPSTAPATVLAAQLFRAIVDELALVAPPGFFPWPVELALAGVFGTAIAVLLLRVLLSAGSDRTPALAFLWVGATYAAVIVTMRWFEEFDPFDFRLLGPAFVPILVGTFALILESNKPRAAAAGRALLLGAAAVSLAAHALMTAAWYDGEGYAAHARLVRARYAAVPKGATVVFGDQLAVYLRPDLHIDAPCTEQGENCGASWEDYLDDLTEGRPIYVDIGPAAMEPDHHSPSVRRFVASHQAGDLLRVR